VTVRFCTPKELPHGQRLGAARKAVEINPANRPHPHAVNALAALTPLTPEHLALVTSRWWGANGVRLTVSFLENTPGDLQARILLHANAWGAYCNAGFTLVGSGGQLRITLAGDGYWSYVGTDCASIPAGEPTMCLQDFSTGTPESEYRRVVRHEFGHAMGFPHEHQRAEIIALLDRAKTFAYGERAWGWDEAAVVQQVLTPLPANDLTAGPADQSSIMAYQLPGECTISGRPIPGGLDIDPADGAFAAQVYPGPVNPPPPPGGSTAVLHVPAFVRPQTLRFRTPGGVQLTLRVGAGGLHGGDYREVPAGSGEPGESAGEPVGGPVSDSFDAVMAALTARFAGRPIVEATLATVKALGDVYLAGR
jgi:hypothetical protein